MVGNRDKAGGLTSLALIWFFSFGHIIGILNPWTAWILGETVLYGTILLLAICLLFIIRSQKKFIGLTRFLNVFSIALFATNLIFCGQALALAHKFSSNRKVDVSVKHGAYPNIYFIVVDEYARADVLSELYAFDNSPLIDYLEQKGFYVASRSYSNYSQTYFSLAATLNLAYLNELASQLGPRSNNQAPLIQMIRHSRIRQLLKAQGYSIISFQSGYTGTEIRDSDLYVQFQRSPSEFRNVLISTTPLPLLIKLVPSISPYTSHRNRIIGAFQKLTTFRYKKSPFFLIAHIMAPHPPFVFGKDGKEIDPAGYYSTRDGSHLHGTDEASIQAYIKSYRDELAALNEKIRTAIDGILMTSPDPVIILQGDHGPRALTIWDNPAATYQKEAMAILNAVYLPGRDYQGFYQDISPINTFIVLLNRIFGTDISLLEDRSYFSTFKHPYDFFPLDENSFSQSIQSIREIQKKLRPRE